MVEALTMIERHGVLPPDIAFPHAVFKAVPPMTRFVFRGDAAACAAAGAALGIDFPPALRAAIGHKRAVLWQGPDEFLVLAEDAEQKGVWEQIETALGDIPHSLVDVSHRNVAFTLEGEGVEALLSTAVMLDLSLEQFPVGMTTRTLFAKADVTLWRQDRQRFHVECWRSFASYVTGLLAEGARGR